MAFLKLRKSFIEAVNAATERTKAELPKLDVPKDACLPPLSHRDPQPAARPQPPLIDARGRIVAEPSRSPPATGPPATGPPRT